MVAVNAFKNSFNIDWGEGRVGATGFNISVQQHRTNVEANVEAVYPGLKHHVRDFKIYDAVVNENATKQQYHWLKEEK